MLYVFLTLYRDTSEVPGIPIKFFVFLIGVLYEILEKIMKGNQL